MTLKPFQTGPSILLHNLLDTGMCWGGLQPPHALTSTSGTEARPERSFSRSGRGRSFGGGPAIGLAAWSWSEPREDVGKELPGQERLYQSWDPLQGVFLTQGWNPRLLRLLHCRQILLQLSPQGNPLRTVMRGELANL